MAINSWGLRWELNLNGCLVASKCCQANYGFDISQTNLDKPLDWFQEPTNWKQGASQGAFLSWTHFTSFHDYALKVWNQASERCSTQPQLHSTQYRSIKIHITLHGSLVDNRRGTNLVTPKQTERVQETQATHSRKADAVVPFLSLDLWQRAPKEKRQSSPLGNSERCVHQCEYVNVREWLLVYVFLHAYLYATYKCTQNTILISYYIMLLYAEEIAGCKRLSATRQRCRVSAYWRAWLLRFRCQEVSGAAAAQTQKAPGQQPLELLAHAQDATSQQVNKKYQTAGYQWSMHG